MQANQFIPNMGSHLIMDFVGVTKVDLNDVTQVIKIINIKNNNKKKIILLLIIIINNLILIG